jgi:hypothetical protein
MGIQRIVASSGQAAISQQSKSSPQAEVLIAIELAKLAESRQAGVSNATLEIYCSHLSKYSLQDIRAAVSKLSLLKRAEGETAFPDLATLDEAVRCEGRDRRIAEAKQLKRTEEEAYERKRRDHPEDFISIADIVGDFYKTKGMHAVPAEKKEA